MKVYDVLHDLTYGELAQYKVGGLRTGGMVDTDLPRILSLVNRGILAINSRADLLRGIATIRLNEGRTLYPMRIEYSVYAGSAITGDKFIMDTADVTFPPNFKKFIQISNNIGEPLLLNNRCMVSSLAIPSFDVFQIADPITDAVLFVEFSYDPTIITASTIAATQNIEYPLPRITMQALYAYVALKMTENLSSAENKQEQAMLTEVYEREIKLLLDQDLLVGDTINSLKFYNDGWI